MSTKDKPGDLVPGSWNLDDEKLQELIERFRDAVANRSQFLTIYLSDSASEWTTGEEE